MQSLRMLTVNSLVAANSVIISVEAQYLPARGMTKLMDSTTKVQKSLNKSLKVEGALIKLVDPRTNLAKDITATIRENYGNAVRVFKTTIPIAVKAAEASAYGKPIFTYEKSSTVAEAYGKAAKEVMDGGRRKRENDLRFDPSR